MVDSNPVALVTGAGSGIGRAAAVELSNRGYDTVLLGRRLAPLEESMRLLAAGTQALAVTADVADPGHANLAVDSTLRRFGRLDALVLAAGAAPMLPIDRHTPEVVSETFSVNAMGPASIIARAWPAFTRQHRGVIVLVSSMASIDPFPGFFAYAAAKSAVNMMAHVCANEGKAHNIRAFAVAPGAVETPLLRSLFSKKDIPPSAALAPDSVATVIADCITGARDRDNGTTIPLRSPGD